MRAAFAVLLKSAALFHNKATLKVYLKGNVCEDFETGYI